MIFTKFILKPIWRRPVWFLFLAFFLMPLKAMEMDTYIELTPKQQLFLNLYSQPLKYDDIVNFMAYEQNKPSAAYGYDDSLNIVYLTFSERFEKTYGNSFSDSQKVLRELFIFYWGLRSDFFKGVFFEKFYRNDIPNEIIAIRRIMCEKVLSTRLANKEKFKKAYNEELKNDSASEVPIIKCSDAERYKSILKSLFPNAIFSPGYFVKSPKHGGYTSKVYTYRRLKKSPDNLLVKFKNISFVARTLNEYGEQEVKYLVRLRYYPQIIALGLNHLRYPFVFPRLAQLVRSDNCVGIFKCVNDNGQEKLGSLLHGAHGFELGTYLNSCTAYDAREILEQVGETLANAHSKGVGHGDFSPRNIFVKKSRVISWVDLADTQETLNLSDNDRILYDLMRFYTYEVTQYLSQSNKEADWDAAQKLSEQFKYLLKGYLKVNNGAKDIIAKNLSDFFEVLSDMPLFIEKKEMDCEFHFDFSFHEKDLSIELLLNNKGDIFWGQGYWQTPIMDAVREQILKLAPFDTKHISDLLNKVLG